MLANSMTEFILLFRHPDIGAAERQDPGIHVNFLVTARVLLPSLRGVKRRSNPLLL
jgi:hypothetical protein